MIKSVLHGKDYEALNILIPLHCKAPDPKILDCTWGKGTMWNKANYQPCECTDVQDLPGITHQIDFTRLHTCFSQQFDVVVFDPPHLPGAAASEHSACPMVGRFGLDHSLAGDNVNGFFEPALTSIKQVLEPGGIVLVKIADLIHNHAYQWQQVEVVLAARAVGLTPCDMLIKCDPSAGNLTSSKWENQYHLRKAHCYWIVLRKGGCER